MGGGGLVRRDGGLRSAPFAHAAAAMAMHTAAAITPMQRRCFLAGGLMRAAVRRARARRARWAACVTKGALCPRRTLCSAGIDKVESKQIIPRDRWVSSVGNAEGLGIIAEHVSH